MDIFQKYVLSNSKGLVQLTVSSTPKFVYTKLSYNPLINVCVLFKYREGGGGFHKQIIPLQTDPNGPNMK